MFNDKAILFALEKLKTTRPGNLLIPLELQVHKDNELCCNSLKAVYKTNRSHSKL